MAAMVAPRGRLSRASTAVAFQTQSTALNSPVVDKGSPNGARNRVTFLPCDLGRLASRTARSGQCKSVREPECSQSKLQR
jgi:hypothetical protein